MGSRRKPASYHRDQPGISNTPYRVERCSPVPGPNHIGNVKVGDVVPKQLRLAISPLKSSGNHHSSAHQQQRRVVKVPSSERSCSLLFVVIFSKPRKRQVQLTYAGFVADGAREQLPSGTSHWLQAN